MRQFNSQNGTFSSSLGAGWRHNFDSTIISVVVNSVPMVQASRANGVVYSFTVNGSAYVSQDADVTDRLTRLVDGSNNTTGWTYYAAATDSLETYNAVGKLISIQDRAGFVQTLAYSNTTDTSFAAQTLNRLLSVTDSFGRQISFAYDTSSRIKTMTDPMGRAYTYGYDGNGNLSSVTYPDSSVKGYLYGEAAYTSNTSLPHALTGIVDEKGIRYASYYYDAQARAFSSQHAGGVDQYQITYNAGNSIITDPLGTSRTYNTQSILGVIKTTNNSQPGGSGCGASSSAYTYDANGNIASRTDFNGNRTNYSYDLSRNLETSRIEGLTSAGATTAATRTITTTWHPTYRIPATITEPTSVGDRVTTFGFDNSNGNILSKTVTVNGSTRSWSWTYDSYGRVLTSTDPRGKVTTNTYYPNTAAQNTTLANSRGMLASVANALNQAVTITSYNPHGQPLTIVDANGLATALTYDVRQRLKTRTVGTETTGYTYDGVGQLTVVTLPDGSTLTYSYDDAHRLYQIQDGLGNKVVYTLDNMGNRTAESYKDPAGVLARTRTHVYDALSRLYQEIGGADPAHQVTQFGYDSNGNLKTVLDPLARTTTQNYDALNRLFQVIDPVNGSSAPTKYEYDAQDNLTKVTDPKNLDTVYAYNGFNELLTQTSPDTGATSFTYDAAGNLYTKTDARGVTATYTYDDLNRLITISYPVYQSDPAETVTYTYDNCSNGIGRLCSLSDKTGTTAWSYDLQGRILGKAQTVGGVTQTVGYHYNNAGQMDVMTLPSGKAVVHTYVNNRVASVTVDGQPVIKSADYEPFGPVGQWTWGNDTTANPNQHIRSFDLDGRTTRVESGAAIDPALILYDAASRITDLQRMIGSTVDLSRSNSYGYDNLDRLTTSTPNTGNPNQPRSYSYDGVGNRQTDTLAGATTTYGYNSNSHQLQSLSGATAKTFGYDAVGNKTTDGTQTWSYGGNNRPISVSIAGSPLTTVQAGINALGQRVTKTVNGVITRFVYDEQGKLIGEYLSDGTKIREHIWLNDLPVGVIQ